MKRRRPLVAALLSLCLPGLGQGYSTHWRRGGAVFLAALLADILVIAVAVTLPPSRLMLALLAVLFLVIVGVRVLALGDAAVLARRVGTVPLTRFNRWWVYLSLIVLALVLWEGPISILQEYKTVTPYRISSESMLPTLVPGDYVLAARDYYKRHDPEAGEIAVYSSPADKSLDYIKRVVGTPGHRVALRANVLLIDGKAAGTVADARANPDADDIEIVETAPNANRYSVLLSPRGSQYSTMPERLVPEGQIFVLGDNRDRSVDSRVPSHGLVPRGALKDKLVIIYWSQDWRRIGTIVQ